MEKHKIILTEEKETLLVPLHSKAMQSQLNQPILIDLKAEEILNQIEYDFEGLHVPKQTLITLAMRAKQLDTYVNEYLKHTENPLVIHLGCGLDSRVLRVAAHKGDWYDLDYPDVIALRKNFYDETDHYHMISSSVTDFGWLDQVHNGRPACIIAEGLLMYLHEHEIEQLFLKLQEHLPASEIAFDAYSTLTAKNANNHPSIKKTGAKIHWGIDDVGQIAHWGSGVDLLEEWYFTDSEDISTLAFWDRLLFRMMGSFRAAKKAHRILHLHL
ncbi:MAG: class I SAM-dependent methyltransferase [Anaerolineaceae bacterium]|nr:class I SAM-dependent methyltransferase [Anaerolineaceae bacterium]